MDEVESNKGKFIGDKNPNFGKRHTDEVKNKISKANSGRIAINRTLNKTQVFFILEQLKLGKAIRAIAKEMHISRYIIGDIKRNISYKELILEWRKIDG